jgi:hypothetical protein
VVVVAGKENILSDWHSQEGWVWNIAVAAALCGDWRVLLSSHDQKPGWTQDTGCSQTSRHASYALEVPICGPNWNGHSDMAMIITCGCSCGCCCGCGGCGGSGCYILQKVHELWEEQTQAEPQKSI